MVTEQNEYCYLYLILFTDILPVSCYESSGIKIGFVFILVLTIKLYCLSRFVPNWGQWSVRLEWCVHADHPLIWDQCDHGTSVGWHLTMSSSPDTANVFKPDIIRHQLRRSSGTNKKKMVTTCAKSWNVEHVLHQWSQLPTNKIRKIIRKLYESDVMCSPNNKQCQTFFLSQVTGCFWHNL